MMTGLLKLAAIVFAVWVAIVGLIALSQTALLFPRWAVGAAPALPAGAVTLRLSLADGTELHGHRLPARSHADPPLAPILAFGGNGWNAGAMALFLHRLLPDREVIAFHYRGYAPSTGSPSARALQEDALAIHDDLVEQGMAAPVVVGISIGTGPAAELAARRPVAGVVLVTPFDSLTELARSHYPWAPVRLLLRHRMEPATALAGSMAPVAIIAATRDQIIPPARTEALRAALASNTPGIVFDHQMDADHNDIFAHLDFADTLRRALAAVAGPS